MRRLVGLLREKGAMPEFAPQPGMATIDSLLDGVRAAGLPVELEIDGDPRELPAGGRSRRLPGRPEALTNALKYAGPAHAWVVVRWRGTSSASRSNDGRSDGDGTGGGHTGYARTGLAVRQDRERAARRGWLRGRACHSRR